MNNSSSLNKTREMTKMALMIAILCISNYLIIPLPFSMSPIALSTMIVNLNGMVLDAKQCLISMCVYLLIGLAGVPIFTGGSAGPGKLFGPTGGYILGWVVAAVLIAYLRSKEYSFKQYAFLGIVISIPVIYLFGVVQLEFITHMGWSKALLTGALPFIPMDIVKAVAAAYLAGPILRIMKN